MTSISRWGPSIVIALFVLVTAGCVTRTYDLVELSIGMNRDQVQVAIGSPDTVRLGGVHSTGKQTVEIWEYHLYDQGLDKGMSALIGTGRPNVSYWLYFEDGQLFRWGPAGDKPALPVR